CARAAEGGGASEDPRAGAETRGQAGPRSHAHAGAISDAVGSSLHHAGDETASSGIATAATTAAGSHGDHAGYAHHSAHGSAHPQYAAGGLRQPVSRVLSAAGTAEHSADYPCGRPAHSGSFADSH